MSSSAYNFVGAEHTVSIPEQLNLGARALLIDTYYGYKDNGIVRTNLAGGANRADIQREFGSNAVKELDRLDPRSWRRSGRLASRPARGPGPRSSAPR